MNLRYRLLYGLFYNVYLRSFAPRSAEIGLDFAKLGGVEVGRGESLRRVGDGEAVAEEVAVMLEAEVVGEVVDLKRTPGVARLSGRN
jgi:hypothetical protein